MKLRGFKCLCSKKKVFLGSLSYRGPYFSLSDDVLEEANGNNTCFVEY